MVTAPPVRRRLVGGALRRYRENLGYTLDDAARILECDRSKISRIETGQRGIRGKELRELLAEYGIGDEQQNILAALAAPRGASGWHRDLRRRAAGRLAGLPDPRGVRHEDLGLRGRSGSPRCCRPRPTRGHWPKPTRALPDSDARDRAVAAVLARQKAILGERKPDIHVIIGEAALHQEVGGRDGHGRAARPARRDQRRQRRGNRADPAVQQRGARGRRRRLAGDACSFDQAPGLGVVHLGGASGGVCLESQADLAVHARVFEQLRAFALSPAQSALLLRGPGRRLRPPVACATAPARSGGTGPRSAGCGAPRTCAGATAPA